MNVYTLVFAVAGMATAGYIIVNWIELKKKQVTITASATTNGKYKNTHFADYVEEIDTAYKYAVDIYNEQYAECERQKLPKEQAEKILKPLYDKLKLLETAQKIPKPILQAGAKIADVGITKLQKAISEL